MSKYQQALQNAVEIFVASYLDDLNIKGDGEAVPSFSLEIRISGSLGNGADIQFAHRLGSTYIHGGTEGPDLEAVLEEEARRYGFTRRQSPLRIKLHKNDDNPF